MAAKKPEEQATSKNPAILPIDKKQVKELKTRAKALVDTFTVLGNALKKAATAHEEFVALLPPHLEGITHALQSIEEAQKKKRKRAERDPDAPKKPPTSYFLFSNAIRAKVKEENPEMDQQALATLMGSKWKALTAEERKVWEDKAHLAKEKYAEEDKAYKASKVVPGKKVASEESSEGDDDEEGDSEEEEKPAKKARKDSTASGRGAKVEKKPVPEVKKKEDTSRRATLDKNKSAAAAAAAAKGKEKVVTPVKKEVKKVDDRKKGKK